MKYIGIQVQDAVICSKTTLENIKELENNSSLFARGRFCCNEDKFDTDKIISYFFENYNDIVEVNFEEYKQIVEKLDEVSEILKSSKLLYKGE
ncbi:MAG: hypothetical protein ACRC18_06820 [Cetobacterium sp.]